MTALARFTGLAATVGFVLALTACAAGRTSHCPVTVPNALTAPGEQPSPSHHGNGRIWTQLWPDGTIPFRPGGPGSINADGSLSMKFPWWRGEGVRGRVEISGRRLDGDAPPLRAILLDAYGETGFQPSTLIFSSEGCWEVTARVGDDSLTVVVRVVRESS